MMRNTLLTAVSIIALLLPGVSFAQSTPRQEPFAQPKASTAKEFPSNLKAVRVSTLKGMTVKNQQGDTLGEIEELMVDVQDGRVAYAALDVGGWFDVGGKYVAVPWGALKPNPDTKTVTLNVDKDKLRQAPNFARGSWPDTVERVWLVQVYNFYGVSPYPEIQAVTAERVSVARASTLMDMDVENAQGQDLGEIEDLMIALDDGHIVYAVLAYGGWLGLGENMAAVPWKALKLNPSEQKFTLNIDKDKLRDAPHFAKNQWPQTVDPHWLANVYAFYGERPDWNVR